MSFSNYPQMANLTGFQSRGFGTIGFTMHKKQPQIKRLICENLLICGLNFAFSVYKLD